MLGLSVTIADFWVRDCEIGLKVSLGIALLIENKTKCLLVWSYYVPILYAEFPPECAGLKPKSGHICNKGFLLCGDS